MKNLNGLLIRTQERTFKIKNDALMPFDSETEKSNSKHTSYNLVNDKKVPNTSIKFQQKIPVFRLPSTCKR